MEYEAQYARLVTNEKLPDRFLNTQFRYNPDLSKSSMGQVFNMVEILTPWLSTSRIGQTIIDTFFESYYQGGSTSDLANFEEALKKVNESLAHVTQNGETEWIGNINAAIGIVVENKLHVAQAGKAEAYIFRDGKTNHLTYGLAQSGTDQHPLKTFSNITSGELKPHDKILIANPDLYKYLSIESIRQIVNFSTPTEALLQITKLLKKKKAKSVNILIINLLDTNEVVQKADAGQDETIYLDKPIESVFASAQKTWNTLIYPIMKIIGNRGQKAGKKSVEFTKNYLKKLQEKKKAQEPLKKKDLFDKEFIDSPSQENLLKDEEIQYSPELDVHYYQQDQKEKNSFTTKFLTPLWNFLKTLLEKIITLWQNKKTRPIIYVAIAIIIFAVLGVVISKRGGQNENVNLAEAQEMLKEAEKAQTNAKQSALSNNVEDAKLQYTLAIDTARKIENTAIVGDTAKQVLSQSLSELDKLTSTTRYLNMSALANVENGKSVFVYGGNAYIITDRDVFRTLISGGKPEKVASIPKGSGDFQYGTLLDSVIYLYTANQKVFEFDIEKQSINPTTVDGKWETATAFSSYASNIYILDGIVGQIYKHPYSNGEFSAGEAYVNSGSIDVKNTNSLTIDGSLFVMKSNGEVIKLQRGRLQDFEITDIPTPKSAISKPAKIYTDADMPSLFILDSAEKRVLEFNKDGRFIHQYAFDNIAEPTDFLVSYKSKKLWVLSSGNLYEVGL